MIDFEADEVYYETLFHSVGADPVSMAVTIAKVDPLDKAGVGSGRVPLSQEGNISLEMVTTANAE